ncbi:cerato-ulmin [Colletotrichum tofieldiae]|uniref:Cerato-ulmin n=1 Tax=Colletotrichum tofieldiae TaxID=708197 RepID=A0A161YJF2_9PEZI|nr:cerato-ulmin [Colletotrichum tofieldiae]
MKPAAYLLALFASVALTAPAGVKRAEELDICELTSGGSTGDIENETTKDISVLPVVCSLGKPLCCATDSSDVESLHCAAPSTAPVTIAGFEATCLVNGYKHPRCCVLDLLGHAVSCESSLV